MSKPPTNHKWQKPDHLVLEPGKWSDGSPIKLKPYEESPHCLEKKMRQEQLRQFKKYQQKPDHNTFFIGKHLPTNTPEDREFTNEDGYVYPAYKILDRVIPNINGSPVYQRLLIIRVGYKLNEEIVITMNPADYIKFLGLEPVST